MKTAILFGATGLIGNHLLDLLLKNPAYYKIKVFVRKEIKKKHPKLETYNINFNELDKYTNQIIGDDCFFCIGTTRKQTPDKLNYIDTELSLPKKIADLTKKITSHHLFMFLLVALMLIVRTFICKIKAKLRIT